VLGHDADEGEIDGGLVVAGIFLVIRCQPPLLDQPGEALFDHPASRQYDEALLVFELLDDTQPKARAMAEEPAHALHKQLEFPGITAISEDHEQSPEAVAEQAQEQLGSIAVLYARSGGDHAQQQSIGIGEHMPFAALDLFACVVTTAQSRQLLAFDALAIDDSGAGEGVPF
jgi:hypothetical protein